MRDAGPSPPKKQAAFGPFACDAARENAPEAEGKMDLQTDGLLLQGFSKVRKR